jgi:hypothetical protein
MVAARSLWAFPAEWAKQAADKMRSLLAASAEIVRYKAGTFSGIGGLLS